MLANHHRSISVRIALVLALLVNFFVVTPARASGGLSLYVKWNASGANNGTSWTNAYTDLQSALAAASSGDEIWVAAGTYKPTTGTDRTISFSLKNEVAVYGGFAGTESLLSERDYARNVTILSGDIGIADDNSDNSYHVVVATSVDNNTKLDGFTITGGNANGASPYNGGGGMYSDKGSPKLNNIIFTNNYAAMHGGGLYAFNTAFYADEGQAVNLDLTGVVFNNNTAGGNGGGMSTSFYVLRLASSSVNLTNVTFTNNVAGRVGGGMDNNGGNLTLLDVTFSGNTALGGGGLSNAPHPSSTLTNVTFSNNSADEGGGGMLIGSDGQPTTLTNVTFDHNSTAINGGGIVNAGYSHLILTNVTFSDNTADANGGGIFNGEFAYVKGGGTIDLINTTFSHNVSNANGGAIYNEIGNVNVHNSILYGDPGGEIYGTASVTYSIIQGGYTGIHNLDVDPLLGQLQDNGGFTQTMALLPGSPAINAGDDANCPDTDQRGMGRPQGSHCDIGAYEYRSSPTVYYVKRDASGANNGTSWTNAFTDLQSALAASSSGDEIWVAAGTYKPTTGTDRTISFTLKNGVAIYGGFTGTETSREQRNYANNITILSGDIGVQGNNTDNSYHVVVGSNINSSTVLDGFTIAAGNANVSPAFDSGGGMSNTNSSPSLSNLIFNQNSAGSGSGIYDYNSSPTLHNVTFSNNFGITGSRGGAMVNDTNSNSHLSNVTFVNNSVSYLGGAILNSSNSNPSLVNVTFVGNSSSDRGGAIYNWNSNPTLQNVTFSSNTAPAGGAIYNDSNSNPNIVNSILYGDDGGEIVNYSGTTIVTYSIVQGGYAGTGNLSVDPKLAPLADNGGFTQTMALLSGSPAIDAGDDANCPDTDQRGVSRPQGSHCDLGAYEYQDTIPPSVLFITRVNMNPTNLNSVSFTVNFSEPVTGVSTSAPFNDFTLTTTRVSEASVANVGGSGTMYTVTVNTGSGNGTIRLDVVDDNTIVDAANNSLGGNNVGDGNFTTGEAYTIIKTPTFGDVQFNYWAWSFIERLYNSGITSGCSTAPLIYCPEATVTRAQMAVFLLRGIHGSSYSPPNIGGISGFLDVSPNYWAAAWIKELAAEGITSGCGNGNYCPEYPVTRDQMAVFLLRAKHGSSYVPPAATGVFSDVPTNYWAANWIEQLAAEGVTSGCGGGKFCPATPVTRDQMAVFLVRNFNLP